MSKRNTGVLWSVANQGLNSTEKSNARGNIGVDLTNPAASGTATSFLSDIATDANGNISFQKKSISGSDTVFEYDGQHTERFEPVTTSGFLFGDGLVAHSTRTRPTGGPANYWDIPVNSANAPTIVEAPSVLYAMTTLIENSSQNCPDEIWNKHRIKEYDTCSLCRNVTRSPNSLNPSYNTTSTTSEGPMPQAAIAFIPPKHWAFISGVLTVDKSLITQWNIREHIVQTFNFHLTDAAEVFDQTTFTNMILGSAGSLHGFDIEFDSNADFPLNNHNFSFFAYNPSDSVGKYVLLTAATPISGNGAGGAQKYVVYHVHKQIMIFKTPEHDGYDYVYDDPRFVAPPNWKPSP